MDKNPKKEKSAETQVTTLNLEVVKAEQGEKKETEAEPAEHVLEEHLERQKMKCEGKDKKKTVSLYRQSLPKKSSIQRPMATIELLAIEVEHGFHMAIPQGNLCRRVKAGGQTVGRKLPGMAMPETHGNNGKGGAGKAFKLTMHGKLRVGGKRKTHGKSKMDGRKKTNGRNKRNGRNKANGKSKTHGKSNTAGNRLPQTAPGCQIMTPWSRTEVQVVEKKGQTVLLHLAVIMSESAPVEVEGHRNDNRILGLSLDIDHDLALAPAVRGAQKDLEVAGVGAHGVRARGVPTDPEPADQEAGDSPHAVEDDSVRSRNHKFYSDRSRWMWTYVLYIQVRLQT